MASARAFFRVCPDSDSVVVVSGCAEDGFQGAVQPSRCCGGLLRVLSRLCLSRPTVLSKLFLPLRGGRMVMRCSGRGADRFGTARWGARGVVEGAVQCLAVGRCRAGAGVRQGAVQGAMQGLVKGGVSAADGLCHALPSATQD